MAAAQTAADKAAQEAADAERVEAAAAAEKAKADAAAAEKAKADTAARGEAKSASSRSTAKGHVVTGAAVVLKTPDGSERYLYRGATVPAGAFDEKSIKHALSIGLIEKAK